MDVSGRGAERKLPAKRTAAMAKEMGECIIDILKQVRCYKLCRRGKYKGIEQMVENAVIENTCWPVDNRFKQRTASLFISRTLTI
jgi:hypothetical protein